MQAVAELETAPEVAPREVVPAPVALAPVTVAQLSAYVSLLVITGGGADKAAQWERLITFAPWFALSSGRTLDQVHAMAVDAYVVGVRDSLHELQDKGRAAASAEALGRLGALLGAA